MPKAAFKELCTSSSRFRFMHPWRNRGRTLHTIRRRNNNVNSNDVPQSFDPFQFYLDEPLIEIGNVLRDTNARTPNVPSMFSKGGEELI